MAISILSVALLALIETSSLAQTNETTPPPAPNSAQPQAAFDAGLKALQEGQYEQSRDLFAKSLTLSPDNASSLYNLGLSYFRLGNRGRSAAAWRKALYLNPDLAPARKALKVVESQMGGAPFAVELNNWESFRSLVLTHFTVGQCLGLTLVFFVLGGYFGLRYLGRRKKALAEQTHLPQLPYMGMVTLALAGMFILIGAAKGWDSLTPRATVVDPQVEVRTGPSDQDNSIMTLSEGFEVIVQRVAQDWVQVKFPGGTTGWVPKPALEHSSGQTPW